MTTINVNGKLINVTHEPQTTSKGSYRLSGIAKLSSKRWVYTFKNLTENTFFMVETDQNNTFRKLNL